MPTEFTPQEKAFHRAFDNVTDVFLQHIRNAGFEDGVDFKWDEGPESFSPRLLLYLVKNRSRMQKVMDEGMRKRGYRPMRK